MRQSAAFHGGNYIYYSQPKSLLQAGDALGKADKNVLFRLFCKKSFFISPPAIF
jgi:hypothetical protein